MSLKRVHDEIEKRTPGGKESLLAWVLTFALEALAALGPVPIFVAIFLFGALVTFLLYRFA